MPHSNDKKTSLSFLQSRAWANFQNTVMGKKIAHIAAGTLSGTIVKFPVGFGNYYIYAPHGPSGVYDKASLEAFIKEAVHNSEFHKAFFLRIEPFLEFSETVSATLADSGFRKSKQVQPEETIVLDIAPSEDNILKQMEHDTRYSIRAAIRRGVSVISFSAQEAGERDAFREFWEMFRETNERHGLRAYSEEYYRGVMRLSGDCFSKTYIAYHEKTAIAAAIIVFFGGRATYLYAASRAGFGKFNAPSLILWEVIRDAKNSGCTVFDFWGASETKKEWEGVTAFKKSFGGRSVRYTGTWDYAYNKPKYSAYMAVKKIL